MNEQTYHAVLLRADDRTLAGLIYPRAVLEEACKRFNDRRANDEEILGELDGELSSDDVSSSGTHRVISMGVAKNGDLWADVQFLPVFRGYLAEKLVLDGRAHFCLRCTCGTIDPFSGEISADLKINTVNLITTSPDPKGATA